MNQEVSFCNHVSFSFHSDHVLLGFYYLPPKTSEEDPKPELVKNLAISVDGFHKILNLMNLMKNKIDGQNPPKRF